MDSYKRRVYILSSELGLENKEVLAICKRLGIKAKSHSSTLAEEDVARLRAVVSQDPAYALRRPGKKPQSWFIEPQKPSQRDSGGQSLPLTVRCTPRTGRGFIEPLLDVGDAIPLHMVRIPGGTFTMGSPDDEPEREERESPQHEVTVPMCFMGRYPITQAQYEQVMETNPATQYGADRFVAPNKPVVGVSWDDATTFCQRLSERTGRTYRLPSEAEWEYACRAGTTTPFYFGSTLTTEVANYDGNYTYVDGPEGEDRNELTPVDHFQLANAFGLCDMHGNVDEWCADHWHENYEGAPTDGSAWIEGGDSSYRVVRGGSWDIFPRLCRSAYRVRDAPVNANFDLGFRVVCSPPRALL